MRILTFILAFIILSLSCLPCADDAIAMKADGAKAELVKIPIQQDDKDHDDACSPFCQCACCAGASLNHSINSIHSGSIICPKQFTSYLPLDIIEISLPIWQPPKLVA